MFIKGIKRNYLRVLEDESIADEDKIDALLMRLGGEFLVSKEDRVALVRHQFCLHRQYFRLQALLNNYA